MSFNLSHDDFENTCWEYYLQLENRFLNITKYIMIDRSNYKTYSFEIMNLILCICVEIESVIKIITGNRNFRIFELRESLLKKLNSILEEKVLIIGNHDIYLEPFKDFDKLTKKTIQNSNQRWWYSYDSIKHNRMKNIKNANFENLINSLSALFILNSHYLILKSDKSKKDSPRECSRIFKCTKNTFRYSNSLSAEYVDGHYLNLNFNNK